MATFRNRHGKWQAGVTRKGITPVSRSFITLQDAERRAKQTESNMHKGAYTSTVPVKKVFKVECLSKQFIFS